MLRRLALMVVLWLLLLTSVPARAEHIVIDPAEPPPTVLGEQEAAKLAALQQIDYPFIFSPISPDDAVIALEWYANFRQPPRLMFVDVQTGIETAIDPAILALPAWTESAWLDNNTLTYLSTWETGAGEYLPVLVEIDRASGGFSLRELVLPATPFYPISLAPDGSKLLVETMPAAGGQTGLLDHSGFDMTVRLGLPITIATRNWGPRQSYRETGLHAFASEALQLAIYDLRSGTLSSLATVPAGSDLWSYAWNPDGARLALVTGGTFDDFSSIDFVLAHMTTQEAMGRLAPAANPFYQNNEIAIFDLNQPGSAPVATRRAPEIGRGMTWNIDWSTDGQTLLAHMVKPAQPAGRAQASFIFGNDTMLRFLDGDLNVVGELDAPELQGSEETSYARWASPDEIFFTSGRGLNSVAYYYNYRSGELRLLPTPAGRVDPTSWVTTRQSRQFVFLHASFEQPRELFRINWEGAALARLTWANAGLQEINQVQLHRLEFRLANGAIREGLLLQPAGAPFPPRNAPLVVWQAGGPGGWMGNNWGGWAEQPANLLANFGLNVLIVPLSGRDGYGPAFVDAMVDGSNFGQIDVDEQAEIVRQLIARGWTSQAKVGISGHSYGAYFTAQSIVRHPDLYAAANPTSSVLEWIVDFQMLEAPLPGFLEGGAPQDRGAEYLRDSPLYNAERIRTPTLIIHGTEDFNDIRLIQNFHDQIAANGTPVRMLSIAGEGHTLYDPASQFASAEAMILWFRHYLGAE